MNNDCVKTIKFIISGRVQGVGFRWFTKRAADASSLYGYVRNLPDGSVEALATGTARELETFKEKIMTGPSYSEVISVREFPESRDEKFRSFEITY